MTRIFTIIRAAWMGGPYHTPCTGSREPLLSRPLQGTADSTVQPLYNTIETSSARVTGLLESLQDCGIGDGREGRQGCQQPYGNDVVDAEILGPVSRLNSFREPEVEKQNTSSTRIKVVFIVFTMTLFSIALLGVVFWDVCITAPTLRRSDVSVQGPAMGGANFPDPSMVQDNGTWYAYATNSGGINVQIATSPDFVSWTLTGQDALPVLPSWAESVDVWAPDVVQIPSGEFVLYYSGTVASSPAHHCVGAAVAPTPMGPFTPQSAPLACPLSAGGAIDPSGYQDTDSSLYVVYKVDGNSIGHGGSCLNTVAPIVPTPIMLQKLLDDGMTPDPSSGPVQILDRDVNDGPLVEAPSLVRLENSDGMAAYVLFFSSNCYTTPLYDVTYAVAPALTGPYAKHLPLIVTGDAGLVAPGGATVSKDGSRMVFHANAPAGRGMFTAMLGFENGAVVTLPVT